MTMQRTTIPSLKLLAAAAAVAVLAACGSGGENTDEAVDAASSAPGGLAPACVEREDFTYSGEDGETALDLLLENDPTAETTGEGETAFVTGICGYTADEAEKEFWALYVDGEQATEGAGALETEDGQEITWKLETF
ncbi:DUF4430 domain-containing protein [Myceligenerans sp. TRM 65318]|uniref:DUF4430 domain-containing protein n=2 Tax=Myceligenerans pegani TaxID=2776917 RepID=A0ABR9N0R5_9MICO|nr:DUF4430 domain-containing protein [Myceligenerans sp. TRM 65318]MBE3019519.1 DUF4430 domain-containing protein [Myceligenerans sp. TRM 65318]